VQAAQVGEVTGQEALSCEQIVGGTVAIHAGDYVFVVVGTSGDEPSEDDIRKLVTGADGNLHVILSHGGGGRLCDRLLLVTKGETYAGVFIWTTRILWRRYVEASNAIVTQLVRVRHLTPETLKAAPQEELTGTPIIVVSFDHHDMPVCYDKGWLHLEFTPSERSPGKTSNDGSAGFDTRIHFNGSEIKCRWSDQGKSNGEPCRPEKRPPWQYPNSIAEISKLAEWPNNVPCNKDFVRGACSEASASTEAATPAEVFKSIAVAIQASVSPLKREAVRPSRKIEVQLRPDGAQGISRIMPILEWRLRQVGEIHRDLQLGVPIPVLLMISYQTRDEVLEVLKGLCGKALPDANPLQLKHLGLEVYLLQQPLVRWHRSDDKPALSLAGHLDLVRLALHWYQNLKSAADQRRYLVSFPHNNLGTVFDQDELARNIDDFQNSECFVGVEVFKEKALSERYSYRFVDRLWKPDYTPPAEINGRIAQEKNACETYWASSHTWYFDLERFAKNEDLIPKFWIEPGESGEQRPAPRQDLELLTHQPGCSVCWFSYASADGERESARHKRFRVAYHEGEVQSKWASEAVYGQPFDIPRAGSSSGDGDRSTTQNAAAAAHTSDRAIR
jgi:hypothetical protein